MTMLKEVKKLYVSGPMSGLPGMNFDAFNSASAALQALGYETVNPVDLNPDPNADWLDCITVDLLALRPCDGIALLPGWERSFGAQIERLAAQRLGLSIFKIEDLLQAEAA